MMEEENIGVFLRAKRGLEKKYADREKMEI